MNRQTTRLSALAFAVSLCVGCSTNGPIVLPEGGPTPPHGGRMVKLMGGDNKGFVEIVYTKPATKTASVNSEVAFYFFEDTDKPYSPGPTAGTLAVGKKTIKLNPSGDALVTPAGPQLFGKLGDVEGTLTVELDGKSRSIPLGMR